MPEATYILLDCSSYARNGDFRGTRWGVTKETVDLICDAKTRSNVENSVALVNMKYSGAEISLHLTKDPRWTGAMQTTRLSHGRGQIEIDLAIRKARLALKHRRNDKQTKRIIVIVCSPVHTEAKPLIKCAKQLKKNGYYLDIICFGIPEEEETNTVKKLADMVKACDKDNSCHFLHLADNKSNLRDMVASSPIVGGAVGGGFGAEQPMAAVNNDGAPAAPVPGFEGLDFDPNQDPELAMAIRASLEHQREALAAAEQQQIDAVMADSANDGGDAVMAEAPGGSDPPAEETAAVTDEKAVATENNEAEADDEDEEMRRAMEMSMGNDEDEDEEDLYDDEELQKALQMSMEMDNDEPAPKPVANETEPAEEDNAEDHEFLANLLSELPGVAVDDIDFEEIMTTLNEAENEEEKKNNDNNDKKSGGTN